MWENSGKSPLKPLQTVDVQSYSNPSGEGAKLSSSKDEILQDDKPYPIGVT